MKEKEEKRLQEIKKIENHIYETEKIQYICGIDEACLLYTSRCV